MKGLEGVSALELLAGDGDLETVTEVTVEQAHNLLHGTLDAVGLGHEDAIVLGYEVRVGAELASAVAHARGGDDVNERERLIAEVSEGLRVGQGVCDCDDAIAGVSVNGADVAGGMLRTLSSSTFATAVDSDLMMESDMVFLLFSQLPCRHYR